MINQESASQVSETNINQPPLVYKIKQYKAKGLLSQFSYMLIRPPRFLYNQQLLNPPQSYQMRFKVEQHKIPFKLTLYAVENMLYVILYLHGNSSSRFQGYMHLKQLPEGVGLACFDFSGCGLRYDSQFISLGKKQSKQVDIAAKYLKNKGYKVVGWGRSMGSVSLLLSQQCDILVADSPFYSLADLCKQSSERFLPSICCCFFHCFYPCLFSCVRSDVQQKAGFDLKQLEIAELVKNNPRNKERSLFVMAGTDDNMIHYSHSQKIFQAFPGKKKIELFHGSHNSERPAKALDNCFLFIQSQLGIIGSNQNPNSNVKGKNIKLKPIVKNIDFNQFKIKAIEKFDARRIHPQQSSPVKDVKIQDNEQATQTYLRPNQETGYAQLNNQIVTEKQSLQIFKQHQTTQDKSQMINRQTIEKITVPEKQKQNKLNRQTQNPKQLEGHREKKNKSNIQCSQTPETLLR